MKEIIVIVTCIYVLINPSWWQRQEGSHVEVIQSSSSIHDFWILELNQSLGRAASTCIPTKRLTCVFTLALLNVLLVYLLKPSVTTTHISIMTFQHVQQTLQKSPYMYIYTCILCFKNSTAFKTINRQTQFQKLLWQPLLTTTVGGTDRDIYVRSNKHGL